MTGKRACCTSNSTGWQPVSQFGAEVGPPCLPPPARLGVFFEEKKQIK
jgi:hypothetical protein